MIRTTNKFGLKWAGLVMLLICYYPIVYSLEHVSDTEPHADKTQSDGKVWLKPGLSFAWLPAGRIFYDASRFKGENVKANLEEAIISALSSRGIQLASLGSNTKQADILVGYTVILGSSLTPSELGSLYEKEPELKAIDMDPARFEKGTLIIKVVDPKIRTKLWRGVRHGFVNLDMPDSARVVRIREAVKNMFIAFPHSE